MNSEQVSSGVNNDIIDKKIGELQTKLDKINKNRKISVIISVVGVVLIVIAVLIFFSNLTKFVKHYDVSALMSELQVSSSHFASSEEAKELVHILKQDLLPAYELAVAAKLKESAPVFRSDFDEIKQSVAIHMTEVIKPRLEENLVSCLANSEAVALAENFTTPESVAKIDKVVALTKEHLIEKMPTFIDKRIDPLLVKLASLLFCCHKPLF